MKRAVSISIGTSKRDKTIEIQLLGQDVRLERIGTDGDMEKAAQLFRELDGKVDAFGVGGADLGVLVDRKWYPLYTVQPMIRYVSQTPVVDGAGIKNTLENRVVPFMQSVIGDYLIEKKAFITLGVDRWGMTQSFLNGGFDCIFGDFMFGLGLPIPLRSERALKIVAALMMPVAGRLPFKWVYPTGEKQEIRDPKWGKYYHWAKVIAGDCHYLKRHMPELLVDKVIVTNTTTEGDKALFRSAGVKYMITTTPVMDGRSFGANVLEAALIAISGKKRKLSQEELNVLLNELGIEPQLMELN
ncbi:MAG: quinate 5-dehydrogenase [Anaerolineales bacterium]